MLLRFFKKKQAERASAQAPQGLRLYAVGDIHGRDDLLAQLLGDLEADNRARGPAETHLIFLGDLIDRGPESAQVVTRLLDAPPAFARVHVIMGNHEEALLRAWRGESEHDRAWLKYGGRETLESYGLTDVDFYRPGFNVYDALRAHVPIEHVAFLERSVPSVRFGDYLFVHAGIRPGIALEMQAGRDLRWIREEFLQDRRDHGAVIVHGHTISEEPELLPNRLGIDTGAYRTGRLTALAVEGGEKWLLATGGQT